ncbi:TetR family transcriptional regulator [Nocardia cyriacigeorgica]|uniref:TetR family transcriptional regulator n=1 Tax=Nocardia cyriacigeorgica TaxID=135487 RepID=A0A6P1D3D9_9NOCA|nr:TetR/AcrR family transcriptional regulator C-terminal domain-containing protein [Nocardia cyriacigeorgica]NEW37500.1 TetR family transcriptional regulator [Nocardia cyriacigeorgica]NEW44977.1 TetR family transcriptional regulator [Nocardia cyriacigeorgica]NEW49112.1 TetR family transcriptional regulator [Nocardia cyriacigeorgica]NEW56686.1 TetR family transcriptional regulator [Nocardia cyriacigeorgica]
MTKQFSTVWSREPRQPRSSGLRREQIVAAAVEILDAEGMSALSMRKLGARLDAGATSLYWYVANKDELLELVLDEFWGMVRVPEPDQMSWQEVATAFAYNLRDTMLNHPWVGGLMGYLPSIGPNSLRLSDRLRRTFVGAGFLGNDVYLATGTLFSFVLGQVLPAIAWKNTYGDGEIDTSSVMPVLEDLGADYPDLIDDYRNTVPADPATARAVAFDFGLISVLDGLEVRLRGGVSAGSPAEPDHSRAHNSSDGS